MSDDAMPVTPLTRQIGGEDTHNRQIVRSRDSSFQSYTSMSDKDLKQLEMALSQLKKLPKDFGAIVRPRDLPKIRDRLAKHVRIFLSSAARMEKAPKGLVNEMRWADFVLGRAELWHVSKSMTDLMMGASRQLPETDLKKSLVPDECGLVILEEPVIGVSAEDNEVEIVVSGYLWGPAFYAPEGDLDKMVECISIMTLGPALFDDDDVAITPLGTLIWPYGQSTDAALTGVKDRDVSMAEDRRVLLAMWLLSQQRGITDNVKHEPQSRSKRKKQRIAQGTAQAPSPVRIITLRRPPTQAKDPVTLVDGSRRRYVHRWAVSGHWRNQAYGPGWSDHRPIYINAYLKGPQDAPVLTAPRVKTWTR